MAKPKYSGPVSAQSNVLPFKRKKKGGEEKERATQVKEKIQKKIKDDPNDAKKAALIIENMLKQSSNHQVPHQVPAPFA